MPTSDSQGQSLWHAASAEALVWTALDDDFAVYHRLSGTTHFLNAASKQLLDALQVEPMTTPALTEVFAGVMHDDSGDASSQSLVDLLEQFEAMGLLERRG